MKYPNFELIEYMFLEKVKTIYPEIFVHYYPRVYMSAFNQVWGSTALGFGGCGGSAMTHAYTTVVDVYFSSRSSTVTNTIQELPELHGVYFDGKFAYMIGGKPSEKFFEDVKNHNMTDVMTANERYRADEH